MVQQQLEFVDAQVSAKGGAGLGLMVIAGLANGFRQKKRCLPHGSTLTNRPLGIGRSHCRNAKQSLRLCRCTLVVFE